QVMQHFLKGDNVGLNWVRPSNSSYDFSIFISKRITDQCSAGKKSAGAGISYLGPLYIYPEDDGQQTLDGQPERRPNLDAEIVQEIADGLELTFVPEKNEIPDQVRDDKSGDRRVAKASPEGPEKPTPESPPEEGNPGTFAPIDLLDYIYAVLHSPGYREKYKEFLKIDFPRVPYPSDADTFWQLVALGGELRQIHLLEHPVVDEFITTYPEAGSNEITKRLTKTQPGFILYTEDDHPLESTSKVASNLSNESSSSEGHAKSDPHLTTGSDHRYPNEPLGKIQINKEQHFGMVPKKAWNFYIGGYQPAEKWLKDRRDRTLTVDEI